MTVGLINESTTFGSDISHLGLGEGLELEQVQRSAKAQIMKYLPEITKQLQSVWDERDEEYCELINVAYSKVKIPNVDKQNFYTGIKPSLLLAPVQMWPSITVWCHDSKASMFQADQYDTNDAKLGIEVLCNAGPINKEKLHLKEGILLEQQLDSQIQRLTDAVLMCIKKDPALGGVIHGAIEKPANVTTSLPWSRQDEQTSNWYIFQGKLCEYTVQKNTF